MTDSLLTTDRLIADAELAGTCDVIVAKQRNGSTGTVRLTFDPTTMSFSDPAVAPPAWVSGAAD